MTLAQSCASPVEIACVNTESQQRTVTVLGMGTCDAIGCVACVDGGDQAWCAQNFAWLCAGAPPSTCSTVATAAPPPPTPASGDGGTGCCNDACPQSTWDCAQSTASCASGDTCGCCMTSWCGSTDHCDSNCETNACCDTPYGSSPSGGGGGGDDGGDDDAPPPGGA